MKKLLIVDVQKGFLNDNCSFVANKIQDLVDNGNFNQIIATKFVNRKESQFVEYLNYQRFLTDDETEIALNLPKNAKIVEKTSYSLAGGGENDFLKLFNKGDEVFICGLDYDSCVLAICFQLFDNKIQPKIVLDAVASHSKKPMPKAVFEKLCCKNFGKESLIKKL